MGKRGPAPKGEYASQNSVLSVRITSDLRSRLDEEVVKNGKGLSREVEHRLRRSFYDDDKINDYFGSRRDYAILKLIHSSIEAVTNLEDPNADWTKDPYLFNQAVQAVSTVLEMIRPKGEVPSAVKGLDHGGNKQGRLRAALLLREIKEAPLGFRTNPASDEERLIGRLKDDLGDLAETATLPFKRVAEIPENLLPIFERSKKNRTTFEAELEKEFGSKPKKRAKKS
ncbi:hypothetical protein [Methylobacterium sp. P1-11]|uniref:hypothetical protein n=1 Tax=Methylobacterium sp. P1-11 TaxID=2024616 RepID=UPI0011EED626|nr:hypothetical protein [Methylobacterium sp. P1-11]